MGLTDYLVTKPTSKKNAIFKLSSQKQIDDIRNETYKKFLGKKGLPINGGNFGIEDLKKILKKEVKNKPVTSTNINEILKKKYYKVLNAQNRGRIKYGLEKYIGKETGNPNQERIKEHNIRIYGMAAKLAEDRTGKNSIESITTNEKNVRIGHESLGIEGREYSVSAHGNTYSSSDNKTGFALTGKRGGKKASPSVAPGFGTKAQNNPGITKPPASGRGFRPIGF